MVAAFLLPVAGYFGTIFVGFVLWIGVSIATGVAMGEPLSSAIDAFPEEIVVASTGLCAVLVMSYLLVALFPDLYASGRRMRAVSDLGWLHDPQAPVLLLRSFVDDALQGFSMNSSPLLNARWEEELVAALKAVGPVVALGRPRERLSPRGASRLYVHDDDWRQAVRFFLHRAALVVVVVGRGSGLAWEIGESLEVVPPERLLFLFPMAVPEVAKRSRRPFDVLRATFEVPQRHWSEAEQEKRERYTLFRHEVEAIIHRELPDSIGQQQFLLFDSDWRTFSLEHRWKWTRYVVLLMVPVDRTLGWTLRALGLPLGMYSPDAEISFRRTLRPVIDRACSRGDANSKDMWFRPSRMKQERKLENSRARAAKPNQSDGSAGPPKSGV